MTTELKWHNPDNLTQEQLEADQGWRFLLEEEISRTRPLQRDIQTWDDTKWSNGGGAGFYGSEPDMTYRVKWPLPEKYRVTLDSRVSALEEQVAALALNKQDKVIPWNPYVKNPWATEALQQFYSKRNSAAEHERRGLATFLISCSHVLIKNPATGENAEPEEAGEHILLQKGKSLTGELQSDLTYKQKNGQVFPITSKHIVFTQV